MRSNNYALASLLLVFFFFFFFFFISNEAQGIRLGNGIIKLVGQMEKTLEKESPLIVEGFRKVTPCENGHCNSGNNRKLLTATSARNNEEGNKKGKPMSSNKEEPSVEKKKKDNNLENSEAVSKNLGAELDLVDIAEMDYSPAKRKPPIHN